MLLFDPVEGITEKDKDGGCTKVGLSRVFTILTAGLSVFVQVRSLECFYSGQHK